MNNSKERKEPCDKCPGTGCSHCAVYLGRNGWKFGYGIPDGPFTPRDDDGDFQYSRDIDE